MENNNNSIYCIFPQRHPSGVWFFSDKERNILNEPFVGTTNTVLDLLADHKDNITILFSANKFPGYTMEVRKCPDQDVAGTWYYSEDYDISFWLCPTMEVYLPEKPDKIFIQVK